MSDFLRNNISDTGFDRDEHELELLAAYAIGALDSGEEMEVERLLRNAEDRSVADELELVAAATVVGTLPREPEPMPGAVRQALSVSASRWAEAPRPKPAKIAIATRPDPREVEPVVSEASPLRFSAWAGWIAAAACLVLAGVMAMPLTRQAEAPISGGFGVVSLAQVRQDLLRREGEAVLASWTRLDTPDSTAATASGDIVWCNGPQRGVMRLSGLAANDPEEFQYQLWIFDEDQKHPIDGGVFDIPATADGEVMVAVDPKIAVSKPTMFAITVEKPGGVVVSDRERIALLGTDLQPVGGSATTE